MFKKPIFKGILIGLLLGLLFGFLYYELYYCERKTIGKTAEIEDTTFDKASMLINKLGMLPFRITNESNGLSNLSNEEKTNLVLCSLRKTIDEKRSFLIGCHFGTDYPINEMQKAALSLFGNDDFLYCPNYNEYGLEKICSYGGVAVGINMPLIYHYGKWLSFEEKKDYAILTGQFAIIEANLTDGQIERQIKCAEESSDNSCVIPKEDYKDIALYNLNYQGLKLKPLYQGDGLLTKDQVFNQFGDKIYFYKFIFKFSNDDYYLDKVEIIK